MGRVSQEQAADNRAKVVATAASLFRERGLDGVGIAELMAEAGLTHGGFYGQFGSKQELAGEACAYAFDSTERVWTSLAASEPVGDDTGRLRRMAEFYFRPKLPGLGCPMATLAGDAARAPAGGPVRRAFTMGLRRLADLVARTPHHPPAGEPDAAWNAHALAVMAAMVGAVVLRQASDDPELGDAIERAVLGLARDRPA
ncbi:MAG: TetR/AcrR family transcriptional regulator [Janthinobacterium lividum]